MADADYYLRKAEYFYQMAELEEEEEDEEEEEEIVLKPIKKDNITAPIREEILGRIPIKTVDGRYFDPIKRHYYRIEPIIKPERKPDVWYPENKLGFRTMLNPIDGMYYGVDKVYDKDGKYRYIYTKLNYQPSKRIGTNFYKPCYGKTS